MLQDQNNDEQNDNDTYSADADNDTSSYEAPAAADADNDEEGTAEESSEDAVEAAPTPVTKKGKGKGKDKKATTKPAKEAAKKKAADKPASEVQNGVTRPQKGTTSANVWDIADAANRTKAGAVRKTILEKAEAKGINGATAATQFARWRTFNGLTTKAAEAAAE